MHLPRYTALLLFFALLAPAPASALEWGGRVDADVAQLKSPTAQVRLEALKRLKRHPATRVAPYVLSALVDQDPGVQRQAAAIAAEKRIPGAAKVLVGWLSHWEAEMRIAAADGLAQLGEPGAVKPLMRLLADPDAKVRLAVVRALGTLRADSRAEVVPLIGRLQDTSMKIRTAAIAVLGAKQDRRAVIPLMGILDDPSAKVRRAAVLALGKIGDPGAGPALVRLLRDQDRDVARTAITTLGALRYARAAEPLIDMFRSGPAALRDAAAAALAALGTEHGGRALARALWLSSHRPAAEAALVALGASAAPLIVELLRDPRAPRDVLASAVEIARRGQMSAAVPALIEHLHLRRIPADRLIRALGETGDPRIQRPLLDLLDQQRGPHRLEALLALEAVIDERAAAPLVTLVSDPSRAIRLLAIRYLGRLQTRAATPALVPVARGDDMRLASAAVDALARSRDPAAGPTLVALLSSRSRAIRRKASHALASIRDGSQLEPILSLCRRSSGALLTTCVQALGGVLRGRSDPRAIELLAGLVRGSDRTAILAAVDALAAMRDRRIPALLIKRQGALDVALRRRIVEVLGNDPSYRAISKEFLLEALGAKESAIRAAAAWALGKLALPIAAGPLARAARDRDWSVRTNAVAGLARLRTRAPVRLLRAAARDTVPYVRANAILGLAGAGSAYAVELATKRLAADRNPWVRLAALRALAHLHPARVEDGEHEAAPVQEVLHRVASSDPDPRVREGAKLLTSPALRRSGTWLALYLLRPDHTPLRDTSFALVTPSGLVKATVSDGRAEAWEENLQPGVCFYELPAPDLLTPRSKN